MGKIRDDQRRLPGFVVPLSLAERLRNAVHWRRLTQQEVAVEALDQVVAQIEVEHNEGRRFPPRPSAELTARQLTDLVKRERDQ